MNVLPARSFDFPALHRALDQERRVRRLTWAQVASEVGTAASTLRRVRSGGRLEADGVRAMVRWLGLAPEDFVPGSQFAGAVIRANGGKRRRFDTTKLFRALDEKRVRERLTWTDVAAQLGQELSPGMLTRLRERGRIEVNLMVAAAAWAGVPIEDLTYLPRVC